MNVTKKILIITPPYHSGVIESAGAWAPLGLIYLAGHLREAGYDVTLYDAMSLFHGYDAIEANMKKLEPDYVLAGAFTAGFNDAVRCLSLARKINPGVVTVLGGVHPTFCYEEVFADHGESVDFIVTGEGEITAPELIKTIEAKGDISAVKGVIYCDSSEVKKNPPREFVADLDGLVPAWDLLDWNKYEFYVVPGSRMAPLSTSRGCINACLFCSQKDFWRGSYRERSAASVLDEIKHLYEKFKINVFFLTDEYPTYNQARWLEILGGIEKMKLDALFLMETTAKDIIRDGAILSRYRKAGFVHIYIGVESADQDQLDRFQKNLTVEESREAIRLINDAGIVSECSFIIGNPDESEETIHKTLELAFYFEPYFPHFIQYAPWPYNNMNAHLEEYIEVRDYSKYNFTEPIMRSKHLTREEMRQGALMCYRKFYEKRVPDYLKLKDPFLKNYLLKSVELMMKKSFLSRHGFGKNMKHPLPIPERITI